MLTNKNKVYKIWSVADTLYFLVDREVLIVKNKFRVLLAERKLNIADVHKDTGIAKTTLYRLYNETTANPDTKTVMKICDFLEATPNDFFGIEESVVN